MYIISFKIVLHNDFNITNLGELKLGSLLLVTILTNLSFLVNLHTFTRFLLILACKMLHLFLLYQVLSITYLFLSYLYQRLKKLIRSIQEIFITSFQLDLFFLQHKLGLTFSLWLTWLLNLETIQVLLTWKLHNIFFVILKAL